MTLAPMAIESVLSPYSMLGDRAVGAIATGSRRLVHHWSRVNRDRLTLLAARYALLDAIGM